jgi:hypothetical protein
MPCRRNLFLILLCTMLPGCALEPVSINLARSGEASSPGSRMARLFRRNQTDGLDAAIACDHDLQVHLLLKATRGACVAIRDESDRSYMGYLRRANRTEFELLNCVTMEVAHGAEGEGPEGEPCAKRFHVPFKSFKTSSLKSFSDISKLSSDSIPADGEYDVREFTPDTLVFTSGRRQRWVEPPGLSEAAGDARSAELIRSLIAETAIGSQVCFIDQTGQRINGVVRNSNSEQLNLMSCVSRKTVPGPGGGEQIQTSHVAFQSFRTESIRTFAVVASPPAEFDVAEFIEDHTEYFIGEFESLEGSKHHWGIPHKCQCEAE